jgi:TetR/AcrR family transcriptional regulator
MTYRLPNIIQPDNPFGRSFEHSEALLDAALREFIDYGYDAASINRILETAQMSKGQFYYHFGSKEALYLALIGVLIGRKTEFMATALQPEAFNADIFTILETQLALGLAFARAHPAVNQFSESFLREKGNVIYDRALAAYNFNDNTQFDYLVARAHERGEFRNDLPLPFIRTLIGQLFTHVGDLAGLQDPAEHDERLAAFMQFIRSGLQRPEHN